MAFAIHQHESAPGIHMYPPILSPPPISHHPIPQCCPRTSALGALLHAMNLHWSSILHMVIYRFKWYFLKSSHPHLLPLSPKVCSLCLCLFCCPAYSIISTVFFKFHKYALIYNICLSLSDLLHSI